MLAALFIFGYIKLFYKTYSEKAVAQSADCVVAIDVKRITNTLIWGFITTPSQWKKLSLSHKKSKKISWDDMVELPNYILAFHAHNQPASIWYSLFTIKDKTDFEKGMSQFGFEKNAEGTYLQKANGLYLSIYNDKVLLAKATEQDKNYISDFDKAVKMIEAKGKKLPKKKGRKNG